ncbi:hypothetical protein [Bacillus salipaludis]|uniref:hypothetical protein n=1 Tax=Bacillus salipaludis TaxID=2547811 RepID=UPI002E1D49CA|nr:hypothetical protein [Bacillus salipaludis]
MNIRFDHVTIASMKNSAGVFLGEKNMIKKFRSDQTVTEVIGTLSGKENIVVENFWVNTKEKGEAD